MTEQRAYALRSIISGAMQSVDDEVAAANTLLFPEWEPDVNLTAGQKVRYNGVLYKVLQAHIAQGGWSPEDAPSMFAKLLIPDEDATPEWEQPDSTNPYMKGDKVTYKGVVYESLIDNNVWSPEAYPAGWQSVEQ